MTEIPDDDASARRFAAAAEKLIPAPLALAEIRRLVQRRLHRRRIARIATVAGAAAAVVVVVLTVDAMTGLDARSPGSSGPVAHAVADRHTAIHATHPAVHATHPAVHATTPPSTPPSSASQPPQSETGRVDR